MKEHIKLALLKTVCISTIFVLFAGCTDSEISSMPARARGAEVSAASDPSGQMPGAFVEENLTEFLPSSYSMFNEMQTAEDGTLSLVGLSQSGNLQRIECDLSGNWSINSEFVLSACSTTLLPRLCTLSDQGVLWGIGQNANNQYALFTGSDPQNLTEVSINAFSSQDTLPLALHVQSDENIILTVQTGESTILYLIDGKTMDTRKITPGFYASPVFYEDSSIYAFIAGSGNILEYDTMSGNSIAQYELRLDTATTPGALSVGAIQDSNFFFADKDGIHQLALGGSLQQIFANNNGFALCRVSFHQTQLAVSSDNNYWVAGIESSSNRAQLYRYYYDAKYVEKTNDSLSIWAMEDCYLLREAISTYATEHPDCTVSIEYGADSLSSGMTREDIIRALNVQIFAGEGPDVLILDGLPIDSYINQGLLVNMHDDIDTSDCFESIINGYQNEGKIYALPLLFRPSLVYCKSNQNAVSLAAAQNLTDLTSLFSVKNNFHFDGYYNVFTELYPVASASIFPVGKDQYDAEQLREFLKVTNQIVNSQGILEEYDPRFGNGEDSMVIAGEGGLGVDIPASMNWYSSEQNPSDCACGSPSDYSMTYITIAATTKVAPALIRPLPGNVFEPVLVAGILSTSDSIESGKQFIQCMLDCETQEVCARGSFNGFFVKKGVQLAQLSIKFDGSNGIPSAAEINLDAVLEQLTTPANTEVILKNAVYEEAKKLYTHQQDIEATVSNIIQKVGLYYAERN